jgi:hypothetical protein
VPAGANIRPPPGNACPNQGTYDPATASCVSLKRKAKPAPPKNATTPNPPSPGSKPRSGASEQSSVWLIFGAGLAGLALLLNA